MTTIGLLIIIGCSLILYLMLIALADFDFPIALTALLLFFLILGTISKERELKSPTRISPQVIVTTTDGVSDTTFIYRRK